MKTTLITPTGDRSEAFALTRLWIDRQTVKPDQWIVIDDGLKEILPKHLLKGIDYVRRTPSRDEGHTIIKNIKEAIPLIQGDAILIIEDDDWYGPRYVEVMKEYLTSYNLVGESNARYYHLPTLKWSRIGNGAHASLCQTGFRKEILPIFINCLQGDPYIDIRIWSAITENKILFSDERDQLRLHCSMKGLKGRVGIGTGHRGKSRYYNPDVGLNTLIRWVGEENARIYMKHIGQSYESALLIGKDRTRTGQIIVRPTKPAKKPEQKITVITCTGDRPFSFDLLRRWMANQVMKPDQWLVVDDGQVPIYPTEEFEYHRRMPTSTGYAHTLCLNMLEVIPKVRNEKVIIMEDDDWYSPTYISYMSDLLEKADLVGLGNLIFYYPSMAKYMEKSVLKQPAFGQTAFRKHILHIIKEICDNAPNEFDLCGKGLIDVFLWKHPLKSVKDVTCVKLDTDLKTANGLVISKNTVFEPPIPSGIYRRAERHQGASFVPKRKEYTSSKLIVNCERYFVVGMKGMPGRPGKTTHHKKDNNRYTSDKDYKLLKSIIKSDLEFYLRIPPNNS